MINLEQLCYIVLCLILIGFIYFAGFVNAHQEIKHECKALGGFYIGNTIFDCKVRKTQ